MTSTRTTGRPDGRTARSGGPRSGECAAVAHAGKYARIAAETGEMRRRRPPERRDGRAARSGGPRSGECAAVVHAGKYAGITAKTEEMRR